MKRSQPSLGVKLLLGSNTALAHYGGSGLLGSNTELEHYDRRGQQGRSYQASAKASAEA